MWIYEEEQKCIDEMVNYANEAQNLLIGKKSTEILDTLFSNKEDVLTLEGENYRCEQ